MTNRSDDTLNQQFPKGECAGPKSATLDLALAKSILKDAVHVERPRYGEGICLDLSGFASGETRAIEWIADSGFAFSEVRIGFQHISGDLAKELARINTESLSLSCLQQLDAETASKMDWGSRIRPSLDICVHNELGPATASCLVALGTGKFSALSLSLPMLSESEAKMLQNQDHELSLQVRGDVPSSSVLHELSLHKGYSLLLDVAERLSTELWAVFSANPKKRLQRYVRQDGSFCYLLQNHGFISEAHDRDGISLMQCTP